MYSQPCFSCGILYLISQLLSKKQNILSLELNGSSIADFDDDEGEEKYQDVQEDITIKEEPIENDEEPKEPKNVERNVVTEIVEIKEEDEEVKPNVDESLENVSWYHKKNITKQKCHTFNPLARNPLYAGGEFCAFTELSALKNHFHPTVSLYSTNILDGETTKYNGDPLKDFTLIRFLDRFVFKNPKKIEEKSGIDPIFAKRKLIKPKGVKILPVNSQGYVKEDIGNIPVDELFLYTYLRKRYEEKPLKAEDEESDAESVQSDEFEEMLDKMTGSKDADDDIDFMDEIGDSLKKLEQKKKGKSKKSEEDDDVDEVQSEDEDFDDDGSDDEFFEDDEDKELLADLTDEDEEELEFLDEEESLKNKKKLFNKNKDDISSLFASAEEFATLLEDEGSSKIKPGTSNAFSNADNASMKQIAWEQNRNRWIKGYDRNVKGKKGKKNDWKGKKRINEGNKFGNKRKKIRK